MGDRPLRAGAYPNNGGANANGILSLAIFAVALAVMYRWKIKHGEGSGSTLERFPADLTRQGFT